MDRAWVRLCAEGDERNPAARSYRVLHRRDGQPQAVEVSSRAPALAGAFAARANRVVPGGGPVMFIAVLHRRPDVDHDFFSRYWRERHASFGPLIPNARSYVQLHADPGAPVDGVCLVGFGSVAELRAGLHADVIAVDARADEEHFIDHSRSLGLVCASEE